jgi:hypothetical protein
MNNSHDESYMAYYRKGWQAHREGVSFWVHAGVNTATLEPKEAVAFFMGWHDRKDAVAAEVAALKAAFANWPVDGIVKVGVADKVTA